MVKKATKPAFWKLDKDSPAWEGPINANFFQAVIYSTVQPRDARGRFARMRRPIVVDLRDMEAMG